MKLHGKKRFAGSVEYRVNFPSHTFKATVMRNDVQLALGPCPGDKAARQVKCDAVMQINKRTTHMMKFREKELRYFYNNFLLYSGIGVPQADEYDKLSFYFDAFVFCAVAASEMENKKIQQLFYKIKPFAYIKALRNISAHYGAPHIVRGGQGSPFFTRSMYASNFEPGGGKMELIINIESSIIEITKIHDQFKIDNPGKVHGTYDSAIKYLESLDGTTKLAHDLFHEVLEGFARLQMVFGDIL